MNTVLRNRLRFCSGLGWAFVAVLILAGCSSSEFKSAKKRAEAGEAQGQLDLGLLYLAGKGTRQSDAEGVKWCRKAADRGLPAAERVYGLLLRDGGASVQRKPAEGREWLEKAANKGDVVAQTELASMLGLFSPPFDYVEAMKWLLIAERNGATNAPALLKMLEGKLSAPELAQARARAAAFQK